MYGVYVMLFQLVFDVQVEVWGVDVDEYVWLLFQCMLVEC